MIDYLELLLAGRADALEENQRQLTAALTGNAAAQNRDKAPYIQQADELAQEEDTDQPKREKGQTSAATPEELAVESERETHLLAAVLNKLAPLSTEVDAPEGATLPLLAQVWAMERSAGQQGHHLSQTGEGGANAPDGDASFWQTGGLYSVDIGQRSIRSGDQTGINDARVPGANWPQDLAAWKRNGLVSGGLTGQESLDAQGGLPGGTSTWVEENNQTQKLDQAVRRDSRRYDGGFFLY